MTFRARYSKPELPSESFGPGRWSGSPSTWCSRSAVWPRFSTWYGVAITSAASSDAASTLPLRSSTRPRCPGIVTWVTCWLRASARSSPPCTPWSQNAERRRTRRSAGTRRRAARAGGRSVASRSLLEPDASGRAPGGPARVAAAGGAAAGLRRSAGGRGRRCRGAPSSACRPWWRRRRAGRGRRDRRVRGAGRRIARGLARRQQEAVSRRAGERGARHSRRWRSGR